MFVFRDRRKTSKNVLTVNKFRLLLRRACAAWGLRRLAMIVEYQLWVGVCAGAGARAYEKTLHVWTENNTLRKTNRSGTSRKSVPAVALNEIQKLFEYIGDTCIINYTIYNSISLKRWLAIKRRRIHTRVRRFVVWSSTDKEFQRARSTILIHSLTHKYYD